MTFPCPAPNAGSSMHTSESRTRAAFWQRVVQAYVGLFFLAAAFLKSYESFFGPHRYALGSIMNDWASKNVGLAFYQNFLQILHPYSDWLAILVIALQGIAGLLLVLNYRIRIAGVCIFFVQFNIYLAVYKQIELRNLNAEALWVAVFYFALRGMDAKLWKLMTYTLVLLILSHLYSRVLFGDPFPNNFSWQYEIYVYHNMGSWPGLKNFFVWVLSGKTPSLLWAWSWWIKLILGLGMLTRYRLYAGAGLLLWMFGVTLMWLSTFTCEGAFWVLILLVWVTHELLVQREATSPPESLLP